MSDQERAYEPSLDPWGPELDVLDDSELVGDSHSGPKRVGPTAFDVLRDLARHHWREILPILGVSREHLTGDHGPCPRCGGKDRFRFDDDGGRGTYFCNKCGGHDGHGGGGDGFALVAAVNGWDMSRVLAEVAQAMGLDSRKLGTWDGGGPLMSLDHRLDDMKLTTDAFRVYAHLRRRLGKNNSAWPSMRAIGMHCFGHLTKATSTSLQRRARRAMAELIEVGLVSRKGRVRRDGMQTSNSYQLNPPDVAMRLYEIWLGRSSPRGADSAVLPISQSTQKTGASQGEGVRVLSYHGGSCKDSQAGAPEAAATLADPGGARLRKSERRHESLSATRDSSVRSQSAREPLEAPQRPSEAATGALMEDGRESPSERALRVRVIAGEFRGVAGTRADGTRVTNLQPYLERLLNDSDPGARKAFAQMAEAFAVPEVWAA